MFDHEDFNTQTVHLSKSSTHLSVTDLVHIQFVPNSIHILSLPLPVHITCKSVSKSMSLYLISESIMVLSLGQLVCRIEEEHLWESKQLGAHSPHVLLNTLVYFNTKYFMLHSAEDHLKLSFTHIMKHWKKSPPGKGNSAGRSVFLRYYCPTPLKTSSE